MFRSPRSQINPPVFVFGSPVGLNNQSGDCVPLRRRKETDMAVVSDSDSEHLGGDCEEDDNSSVSVVEIPPGASPLGLTQDEETWLLIPLHVKQEAGIQMRLYTFWMPILLKVDAMNCAFNWATRIGLLNAHDPTIVSTKMLYKIETVEAIFRTLERASSFINGMPRLTALNTSFCERLPGALEDTMHWLEHAGPCIRPRIEKLGHERTRCLALGFIIQEFVYFMNQMVKDMCRTMMMMQFKPSEHALAASDYHKKIGNDLFQKENYKKAASEYSRAIKINPENHIAFSNRALCHTRCQKYLEAAIDAKRATLIEPSWTKGHYRYCEALFLLGEVQWAMGANRYAQDLCKDDPEGIKDLEQQCQKFESESTKCSGANKAGPSKKKQSAAEILKDTQHSTKPEATEKSTVVEMQRPSGKDGGNGNKNKNNDKRDVACKVAGGTMDKQKHPAVNDKKAATKELPKTPKKKSAASKEDANSFSERVKSAKGSLNYVITAALDALTKQIYYQADECFKHALGLLQSFTLDEMKEMGFSFLDFELVLYGRVSALTGIGKPQELAEARKQLEVIKSYKERDFQCLVYYSYGRIYLKEKKFAEALGYFQDAMQMVKNQIVPCKLTWPQTKEIVKETELDYFKEVLEDYIYSCKFPPRPDGTCRYEGCLSPSRNIYITDPDFKGYVEFKCSQKCLIEYHNACWKAFKPATFDKSEKPCLTPNCSGMIDSIKIIDATGLIKHMLTTNRKAESPRKPKVTQKPTCVKKLKEKNHCKKENSNNKRILEDKATISDEIPPAKTGTTIVQTQQNAWLLYQDRVLVQVSQMMPLLRQEKGLAVSALSTCLKPWLELDLARGNQLAGKMLNWEQERLETLDQAVEMLLQRKNRVWARLFIQLLSNSLDINVELSRWAGRLNDADLKAAKSFVERNADHLEELDLNPLLTFPPLKEIISENSNFISSNFTKYVKQALPHEMRLFIWTLEEHKDIYVSFNILLDEYFVSMIDGHCSVIKKSDNQNSFPAGDKSRRKKKKEAKATVAFTDLENETAYAWYEGDPIDFLNPNEPFSIPSHLRAQVAEFDEEYNGTGHMRNLHKILDNNPDPTVESLYDYFAQILEEHGPLLTTDPLLVGEIKNFPPVALAKIQKSGGFEPFLLESLRFVNIGGHVGLTKHAVDMQRGADYPKFPHVFSSSQTASPNPCNADPYITFDMDELFPRRPDNFSGRDKLPPVNFQSLDLYTCEVDESWETDSYTSDSSLIPPDVILKKHAEVQTYQAIKDSVAVNTEPLQPYESLQGDINKTVKHFKEMEKQISKMEDERNKVEQKHKETLLSLEKDIQEITTNIQITDKELTLFQQKLEEEVKKDQKEKKANQEVLKALKVETDKLVEERVSLTKQIQANKASYDKKLNGFLELSNQAEAEKMSLEDEIKRCKNIKYAAAIRRSRSAQLSILESSRDQRLYGLHAQLADAKTLMVKLDENVQRFPSLEARRQNVRTTVQKLEQKIALAEMQYKEQVEQVKRGQDVKDVLSSYQNDLPVTLLSSELATMSVAPTPSPQLTVPAAPAPVTETRNTTRPAQAPNTVFEKAMESLGTIFPEYTRSDLMKFFKDLRTSNGGSLSNMGLQDVVSGVSQLILDHKEVIASGAKSKTTPGASAATPPLVDPPPVWQAGYQTSLGPNALNLEDPCIICQEEMSAPDRLVLECRHAFHNECITSWLKEKSTCPTCRKDTMFKDFPLLPGRRRQVP